MADPQIEQEMQKLKSDIAALRTDITDLAGALKSTGAKRAGEVRDRVADDIRNTREELRRRLDRAGAQGRDAYHDIGERITEHPLGSLAAAVGIGFVIGKLISMGDRH